MPADLEEFSAALREACPGIRFLRREYWERRNAVGKRIPMEPPKLQLQYFDSLNVPGEDFLAMWVEPEGWTPEWYEEFQMEYPHIDDTGQQWPFLWKLRNEPECMFHLEIGCVMQGFVSTPPYPKYEFIRGSSIFSRYVRDDREQKAAHSSIWRALSKQTTGKLVPYDVKRQRPYESEPPKNAERWAGRHAVAWSREKPHRYICEAWIPHESAFATKPLPAAQKRAKRSTRQTGA